MKELSIEEKARRYDEAMKKVNDYYEGKTKLYSDVNKTLDYLFPALKESEGERIRTRLIDYFSGFYDRFATDRNHTDVHWEGLEVKKVLAWLEKKGETFTKKDIDDAYLKGISDAKHELEKQGEQKPADTEKGAKGNEREIPYSAWSEEDETKIKRIIALLKSPSFCAMDGNKGIIDKNIKYLKSLKERVQSQPKQEWNKEDERICCTIVNDIAIDKTMCKYEISKGICDEQINWLKSLKARVQPMQEWSEEDERILKEMIKIFGLENFEGYNIGENNENALKFLKSLKERYTWKPSDLQLECLSDAIKHYNSLGYPATKLKELLDDLKKLREE